LKWYGTIVKKDHICIFLTKLKIMIIAVHHKINNPGEFWAAAQKSVPNLPEPGVKKVLTIFPSKDMTEAHCIWDADSIDTLNKYLRSKVRDWSNETYFEVDTSHAMGMPA